MWNIMEITLTVALHAAATGSPAIANDTRDIVPTVEIHIPWDGVSGAEANRTVEISGPTDITLHFEPEGGSRIDPATFRITGRKGLFSRRFSDEEIAQFGTFIDNRFIARGALFEYRKFSLEVEIRDNKNRKLHRRIKVINKVRT